MPSMRGSGGGDKNTMDTELLNLPFEIQLVLAAGYLAYRISSAGLDKNHRPTDTAFQILVYGLIAYLTNEQIGEACPQWVAMPASILSSIVASLLWRRPLSGIVRRALRAGGFTNENFAPTTWDHIIQNKDVKAWLYVSVQLRDGYVLESDLALVPDTLPFSCFDADSAGNIAIYVTKFIRPSGKEIAIDGGHIRNEIGAAQITYIPRDEIVRVDLSFDPPNGSA